MQTHVVDHQPGNMTRYHIIVSETDESDHWCVSWPEANTSFIAINFATLDYSYVHEKVNRSRKYELSYVDCSEIIKAMRKTPPFKDCNIRVNTDASGHEVAAYFDPK
jgi:hypothetical protein